MADVAFAADLPLTPPANSPRDFLLWALAVALGVIVIIWNRREKERNDTIALLQATVTELKVAAGRLEEKLDASEERADALAERYALEVKANSKTLQRVAGAITTIAAAPPIQLPPPRPPKADEDYDDTTGVSATITAQKRAELDAILEAFHPNDSDRPKPLPPRPRGKLPSRSG